jgi:hypothetical protein
METEIILVVVIACVLVLDFVLRSIKKKSNDKEDVLKKEDQTGTIKIENKFNYILNRKRNIITFVLLALILKPSFHYLIDREQQGYYDYQQFEEIPPIPIINDIAKLLNHYNSISSRVIDKKREYYEYDLSLFDSTGLKSLMINNFKEKYSSRFDSYIPLNYFYESFRKTKACIEVNNALSYSFKDVSMKMGARGFWKFDNFKFSGDYLTIFLDVEPIYKKEYPREINKTVFNKNESFAYLKVKQGDITFKMKKVSSPNLDYIPTQKEMLECCNMYYDFNENSFFDKNKFKIGYDLEPSSDKRFFYFTKLKKYPLQFKSHSFAYHLKNFIKLKQWIFFVSFGFMGILVLLFNDKIKAR